MVTGSDSESIVVLVASTGHTLDIKVSPNETIANILPRIAQASSIPLSDLEICQESGEIISPNELIGSRRMLRLVARGRCGGEVDRAQASSPPENLSQFWRRSWRDLKHNLYLLWPVFLGLFFYWLI